MAKQTVEPVVSVEDFEKLKGRVAALESAKTEASGTVADHENVEGILRLLARHGIKHSPEHDELDARPAAEEPKALGTSKRENNVSISKLIAQRGRK